MYVSYAVKDFIKVETVGITSWRTAVKSNSNVAYAIRPFIIPTIYHFICIHIRTRNRSIVQFASKASVVILISRSICVRFIKLQRQMDHQMISISYNNEAMNILAFATEALGYSKSRMIVASWSLECIALRLAIN